MTELIIDNASILDLPRGTYDLAQEKMKQTVPITDIIHCTLLDDKTLN